MEWKTFAKGMFLGALAGILLAPDSGKNTRKKIAKKAGNLKDSIGDTYDRFVDTVSEQVGKVKDKAKDMMHKGSRVASEMNGEMGA